LKPPLTTAREFVLDNPLRVPHDSPQPVAANDAARPSSADDHKAAADLRTLVAELVRGRVEFVVIGGVAATLRFATS